MTKQHSKSKEVGLYRKKPVIVQAIKYTGSNGSDIFDEFGGVSVNPDGSLMDIKTLEGVILNPQIGDYIIQGVKNEVYPCKPDIFKQTYEAVK